MKTHWVSLTTSKQLQKKSALNKWVLIVAELFNIAVNYFDAKKSAHCSWVLVVTELVVSGIQRNYKHFVRRRVLVFVMKKGLFGILSIVF